eukprot:s30_g16.t1
MQLAVLLLWQSRWVSLHNYDVQVDEVGGSEQMLKFFCRCLEEMIENEGKLDLNKAAEDRDAARDDLAASTCFDRLERERHRKNEPRYHTPDNDIFLAVENGDFAAMRGFFRRGRGSAEKKGVLGLTALHSSAASGRPAFVEFLLSNNADMDAKDKFGPGPREVPLGAAEVELRRLRSDAADFSSQRGPRGLRQTPPGCRGQNRSQRLGGLGASELFASTNSWRFNAANAALLFYVKNEIITIFIKFCSASDSLCVPVKPTFIHFDVSGDESAEDEEYTLRKPRTCSSCPDLGNLQRDSEEIEARGLPAFGNTTAYCQWITFSAPVVVLLPSP